MDLSVSLSFTKPEIVVAQDWVK
ncbi:uncharacterized protein METZ01_LOCUS132910 [marine metagenome]|uniref:Uncharacterized protein n=1 Tax=marine metagenome TaxID=408172 RepID=A0A381YSN8_9ZZZZ